MLISIAGDTSVDASLAKVKITALADTAMIVFVRNGGPALIAVDGVRGRREVAHRRKSGEAVDVLSPGHRGGLDWHFGVIGIEIEGSWNCTFRRVLAGLLEGLERRCGTVTHGLGQNGLKEGISRFGLGSNRLLRKHHESRVHYCWLCQHWLRSVSLNGCPQAQLELGLCRTIELLVDSRVGAIEGDIGSRRVRKSVKSYFLLGRDGEQGSKLLMQGKVSVLSFVRGVVGVGRE